MTTFLIAILCIVIALIIVNILMLLYLRILASNIMPSRRGIFTMSRGYYRAKRRTAFRRKSNNRSEKALSEIKYPENDTKENIRKYIYDIMRHSLGQTQFTPYDPQVEMLRKVGSHNVDVLLEALSHVEPSMYYVNEVLKDLATDDNKGIILNYFKENPNISDLILEKGWLEEAKEQIIDHLRNYRRERMHFIHPQFIDAVVKLGDPEIYPHLEKYFIETPIKRFIFDKIKMIPGLDLNKLTKKAWNASKYRFEMLTDMAPIAIEYGVFEALEWAIEILPEIEHRRQRREIKNAIVLYTPARGSDKKIRNWFEKNRDKIIYENDKKRFVFR